MYANVSWPQFDKASADQLESHLGGILSAQKLLMWKANSWHFITMKLCGTAPSWISIVIWPVIPEMGVIPGHQCLPHVMGMLDGLMDDLAWDEPEW